MLAAREKVIPIYIEEEMKDSYIDYSMSVIVSRALPDVRDGLKPAHRRVLYGMRELNLSPTAAYKKSARIVGEVLGKYHPHGDTVVYETLVRMAQDFSLRYPLVDGQGNFGSIDGDSAAAMRYTEARFTPIAEEVLRDLDKGTVDFLPNFDESLREPTVLPSLLPNLLVNGASGIAVGMATNIPPHNLREVIDALVLLITKPSTKIETLMECIRGPDFPTGAIILGSEGITEAYKTGRGRVVVRARASIEAVRGGRENIIITEIPFQVNKTTLIEAIAGLIRTRKIDGIGDIRDESDRDGLRVVLELRRDAPSKQILEQLYRHTQMQTTFGVILLALVGGVPRVLNLRELLQQFIDFRHEVVVRRTKFDLTRAEKRAHVLEGLKTALDNLDEVIRIIRRSRNPETARIGLMKRFGLSEVQAQAILDMRLQKLTGLERRKIEDEYRQIIKLIASLRALLDSRSRRMQLIRRELEELKNKFGDERRTEIIESAEGFSIDEMMADEGMVISISHKGFVKRMPLSAHRRESSALQATTTSKVNEDFTKWSFFARTHSHVLFFTDSGRCYWLQVLDIPQGGTISKGRVLRKLLGLAKDETVAACVNVKEFSSDLSLVLVTKGGLVKRTNISAFSNPRKAGIVAISVRQGDRLVDVHLTDGKQDLLLVTAFGKAIRFSILSLREMGRAAAGVRGIQLGKDDYVAAGVVLRREGTILAVTEKGFAKKSESSEYRRMGRGGKGIVTLKVSERVGALLGAWQVNDDDDMTVLSEKGAVLPRKVSSVKVQGRNTQGDRVFGLGGGDRVVEVAVLAQPQSTART